MHHLSSSKYSSRGPALVRGEGPRVSAGGGVGGGGFHVSAGPHFFRAVKISCCDSSYIQTTAVSHHSAGVPL